MIRIIIYTLVMFLFFWTHAVLELSHENKRLIRQIDAQSCRVSLDFNGDNFYYVGPGGGILEGGGFSIGKLDPPILLKSINFMVLEINAK